MCPVSLAAKAKMLMDSNVQKIEEGILSSLKQPIIDGEKSPPTSMRNCRLLDWQKKEHYFKCGTANLLTLT